jgi:outer membrane autotransporter protein
MNSSRTNVMECSRSRSRRDCKRRFWRDWGAQATTTFSGVDRVPLLEQATRLDLAAGVTAKINAGLSLYTQAGYQFAVGDTDGHKRNDVKGDLGLRYTW